MGAEMPMMRYLLTCFWRILNRLAQRESKAEFDTVSKSGAALTNDRRASPRMKTCPWCRAEHAYRPIRVRLRLPGPQTGGYWFIALHIAASVIELVSNGARHIHGHIV